MSEKIVNDAFAYGDYERAYREIRENEIQAKEILLEFNQNYPGELKSENIDTIIEQAKRKREQQK